MMAEGRKAAGFHPTCPDRAGKEPQLKGTAAGPHVRQSPFRSPATPRRGQAEYGQRSDIHFGRKEDQNCRRQQTVGAIAHLQREMAFPIRNGSGEVGIGRPRHSIKPYHVDSDTINSGDSDPCKIPGRPRQIGWRLGTGRGGKRRHSTPPLVRRRSRTAGRSSGGPSFSVGFRGNAK
jgi:hypothetical protein